MTQRVLSVLNTPEYWANSCSPQDIQNAVNEAIAAGGGTVRVPSGIGNFNNDKVTSIGGVDIIGAGIGNTILRQQQPAPFADMFMIDGSNGKKVRISGIQFEGLILATSPSDNVEGLGIAIVNAIDFRIDHCKFVNFPQMSIFVGNSCGVIDHCDFDNPYKDEWAPHNPSATTWAVWAYGIVIVSDYSTWNPLTSYLGQYNRFTVYVEDCNFSRCRHAIASNGNAYYVSRHNHFEKASPYGQNDVHGNAGNGVGGRGLESYENTFDLSDESYSLGQDAAVDIRGGGGVCFNNTVILNPSTGTPTVLLLTESSPPYDVEQFYIWNNIAKFSTGAAVDFNSRINNTQPNYVLEKNYFLRAPNQAQDGFTYTPYTYPHPLVSGEIPPQNVTPWTSSLEEGTYKITMPQQVQVGSDIYNFKQWEDGSTNPARTVNLTVDTTITAEFVKTTVKLSGVVIDKKTGNPLSEVKVTANSYTTTTLSDGTFALDLLPGIYTITFEKTGYLTTEVTGIDLTEGDWTFPEPIQLTPIPPIPLWKVGLVLASIVLPATVIAYKGKEVVK